MSVLRFIDGRTYMNLGLHCLEKSWKANLSPIMEILDHRVIIMFHVQPALGGIDLFNRDL
ncbi:hypothetical protein MTR_0134s0040 [Medicago truncatula]|uniref:Uncharacterized protein n=1 Tax=Medicago truncatula TaxID=3880 RepID=G7ZX42_MEDTR|nr:hypothetical protein MTR_0134s0040 [Medicago truncatula]